MSVLHARSVRANLARIEKAMERNGAKVKPLLAQREELMALRRVFEGQLPKDDAVYNPAFGFLDWPPNDETTAAPPGAVTFHQPAYRYIPETHEQPQVELITVPVKGHETTTGYDDLGVAPHAPQTTNEDIDTVLHMTDLDGTISRWKRLPDLAMPPQVTDAQQASGTAAIIAKQMGDAVGERVDAIMEGRYHSRSKGGWPRGLSRKLTPCLHSAIPHRHRVDDSSKPTELTCVGITYPDPATAP